MAKHALDDAETSSGSRRKLDIASHIIVRSVITNRQAAIVIGESGDRITSIRSKSDADVDVSEQLRGAIERIVTVTGSVEDVSSTYGVIARVLLGESIDESDDAATTADTNTITLRLAVPHIYLGAIIGSGGYRLRQITEASDTKMFASEFCLPLSSERTLSVTGKASGIAKAVLELGKEYLALKSRADTTAVNPFVPVSMFGRYGHPETFRLTKPHDTMLTPSNPYGVAPASFSAQAAVDALHAGGDGNIVLPNGADARAGPARGATKDKLIQQIYIPNDMVGAIIGKQGSKINEIRQLSGSHIKINEPDATRTNERLITVEGSAEQNQLALYMLYQRLESEKRRQ